MRCQTWVIQVFHYMPEVLVSKVKLPWKHGMPQSVCSCSIPETRRQTLNTNIWCWNYQIKHLVFFRVRHHIIVSFNLLFREFRIYIANIHNKHHKAALPSSYDVIYHRKQSEVYDSYIGALLCYSSFRYI